MKVLLIHPPSSEVYEKFKRKEINRLPIGLAYITAVAELDNHDVEVVDAEASHLSLVDIKSIAESYQPDVVGITCTTPIFPIAVKIADLLKDVNPFIKTIIGGPHINALPRESLLECSNIDYVVYGEGERTFSELLRCIEDGNREPQISGVGFKNNDSVVLNSPRSFIKDLDSLPFPARHKFPMDKYFDPDRYDAPYTLVATSRGCPYKCIFCGSSSTWGRKVRFRSAENVLDEIDLIVNKFGIYNITFCDDTFTLGKKRVMAICNGLNERKYDINFLASSRINTLDEEKLEALAKAGCTEISFGVETGDDEILRTIHKNIDLKKVRPVFEMVKKYGIKAHSSYIIGNPGDTHETIQKTIDFAIESGTDAAQFSISTPFPGTPLWQMALKQNKIKANNYTDYKWYYSVVANLSEVSDEDLINYQREAYRRFEQSRKTTEVV